MIRRMRHPPKSSTDLFEKFYNAYNDPRFISSDPVQFLHRFETPEDQEVIGLVASGLAYGRVASIHASVEEVLRRMGNRPSDFAESTDRRQKSQAMAGFRHRWTPAADIVDLLEGVKRVREEKGDLEAGFLEHLHDDHEFVVEAASAWVQCLLQSSRGRNTLLADPASGSACKRLFLFLRWMSRRDAVDPGPWLSIPASKLVVPVDVHMHRAGLALGFTSRKQANLKAAVEMTRGFKTLNSDDPLRFDFALTRPGIMESIDLRDVLGGPNGDLERLLKLLPVSR